MECVSVLPVTVTAISHICKENNNHNNDYRYYLIPTVTMTVSSTKNDRRLNDSLVEYG